MTILSDAVRGGLEADLMRQPVMKDSGFGNKQANQVVGDDEKKQFLFNHGGSFATQFLHAHAGLYVTQKQLRVPASQIEFGQSLFVIADGIQERGNQPKRLNPKTGNADLHAN